VRASGEESFDMVVPAMKVREFNFTEVTRFRELDSASPSPCPQVASLPAPGFISSILFVSLAARFDARQGAFLGSPDHSIFQCKQLREKALWLRVP